MTQPPDDAALVELIRAIKYVAGPDSQQSGMTLESDEVKLLATALEAKDREIARLHAGFRGRIDAGLLAFCADTPDFDMSPGMRRVAADFIMGQPFSREASRAALEPSDKGVGR